MLAGSSIAIRYGIQHQNQASLPIAITWCHHGAYHQRSLWYHAVTQLSSHAALTNEG